MFKTDTRQIQFLSFGFNSKGCLANGLDPSIQMKIFTPIAGNISDLDKLFLSPDVAVAIDKLGSLLILGGKKNFIGNTYKQKL